MPRGPTRARAPTWRARHASSCVAQIEAGITCPLAMTYSCVPALRLEPGLAADWEPLVTSGVYDPRELPGRAEARRADRHGADRA